eukprot:COSAG02_NODE_3317_length_6950_cov_2.669683_8_plen_144_part_00
MGLVLAMLEGLTVLPDLPWDIVGVMPLAVQTAACACYEAFFQANPGLRVCAQLTELRPPQLPALAACLQPLRLAQQLGHNLAAAVPPEWNTENQVVCHCVRYKYTQKPAPYFETLQLRRSRTLVLTLSHARLLVALKDGRRPS